MLPRYQHSLMYSSDSPISNIITSVLWYRYITCSTVLPPCQQTTFKTFFPLFYTTCCVKNGKIWICSCVIFYFLVQVFLSLQLMFSKNKHLWKLFYIESCLVISAWMREQTHVDMLCSADQMYSFVHESQQLVIKNQYKNLHIEGDLYAYMTHANITIYSIIIVMIIIIILILYIHASCVF